MKHRTVSLGSIATITSGGTPDRKQAAYWNGDIPWVKTAQIQNGTIGPDDIEEWITQEGLKQSSAKIIPKGTLLMAMYGQGKTRGQVAVLGLDAAINQACAAIQLKPGVDRDYVYQQLRFRYDTIRALSNTGSQENLNAELIREISFPLPELTEQQAIARKLTTWDRAIKSTEQLIATKEQANEGLMQRLFRHSKHQKHRLSEFVNRVTRKNTTGNNHPITISGRDGLISQSHFFDKRIAAEATEHYTLLKRGEFAYSRSYSAGYPFGAIKRLDAYDEGIVSALYLCFTLKSNAPLLSDYLAYYCESGELNHQIHNVAQEGARNHGLLNVAADDFFAMTMPLPPLNEQKRICNALDTAAEEIKLLRKKLVALQDQKRGLMQKLLTGKSHISVKEGVPA